MGDYAHSPLHIKMQQELNTVFDDISSDEEPVDDRTYDSPFEKIRLIGWTKKSLQDTIKERKQKFRQGQFTEASHPFFLTGRLASVLLRAKNKFMMLHSMSKIPRPPPDGWTDLHTVCYVHDFKCLHKVLARAVEQNAVNAPLQGEKVQGITPLHLMIRPSAKIRERNKLPHISKATIANIKKLLAQKADINAKATGTFGDVLSNCAGTPLHQAMDRFDLVYFLVLAKADINAINNDCNTPLNMCFEPSVPMSEVHVRFLLAYKADPNIQNNAGFNPILRWTARKGPRSTLDLLINAHADLNVETTLTKQKPIHLTDGNVELVFDLIELKADVNAQDGTGKSWFHCAVDNADDPLCRRLLEVSVDISLPRGDSNKSPLQDVCDAGHLQLLRTFIKTEKEDRKTLTWTGPSEDSIEEQYERYKLKNKKPKRGQTAPDPTPNQREVLKILSKHVNPCVIL